MSIKLQPSLNPDNLQQALKILIKTRKQIVQKMCTLAKRRYFLLAQPQTKGQQGQQNQGQPRKLVKKQSKTGHTQQKYKIAERVQSTQSNQQQSQTVQKIKQQSIQRNKRMFQGLNMYLDKAKNKLQQQKSKRQQTNKLLEKAQEKQRQKSEKFIKEELQRISTQYANLIKMRDQNSRQILRIQNQILLANYTQYANQVRNFIFTKAQPAISWRPATKQLQMMARKTLGQREQEIEEKNNKIIESIQKYESKFDFSFYVCENEKQYYNNMLHRYYQDNRSCIRTTHEPAIYWKPCRDVQKLNHLKKAPNKTIEQLLQKNKKDCQEFYSSKIAFIKQKRQKGVHGFDKEHEQDQSHSQSNHKQDQD